MTREEAMKRFVAARNMKRKSVKRVENQLKQAYEQRTGKPATYTFAM